MTNNLISIESIFAMMPSAMALLDTNLVYLAATDKYVNLLHLQKGNISGTSFFEHNTAGHDLWDDIFSSVLAGNERIDIIDSSFDQDLHLKSSAKPFIGLDGSVQGILLSVEVGKPKPRNINEDRFILFMDHFPGLCWISDDQNVLRYANKNFFDTLHLSESVIGQNNEEIFGVDIANNGHMNNMDVLKRNKNKEFYQTFRDESGHPRYFKTYKFPFHDRDGKQSMIGAISFDITKNKQLEEHLYQSDEQFRQAFEHSLIGMALISTDGKWERANDSLCKILGYAEAELQKMNVLDITHPDDLNKSNQFLGDLINEHQENIKLEKRYIHKNGSVIWVMIAATMLKDKNGKPLHYVSHIENITKRKEIEDNLVLSEKKYRTIFENVHDVFYQTSDEGIVIDISPSIELNSGYTREEVIGRRVTDFYYYEQDRGRMVELLMRDGSVIDFEVRLKTKSNTLKYASVNARLVIEPGKAMTIEGSMRDVTTRKFQENALKTLNTELTESNEQKNKLLSIIGHDLRNPISGSLQLLDLTLMDYESTSALEIHAYLSKMKEELSNANELLEDLLTWAKAQFNSFNFNPVKVDDPSALIQNCVHKVLPMALKKGVTLVINMEDKIELTADTGMLETILRNLVSNAVKFTNSGGQITVSARTLGDQVEFAVKDTGTGIPPESIDKLFNKSLNFTTYGTSGEKGTGLGLSLCSDFVSRHGGEIWVESEVKVGSTFYFTTPQPFINL
jgi:PAS domain S-box-containing protein